MKIIPKIIAVFLIYIGATLSLTSCAFGNREITYDDQLPETCRQQLLDCFGDAYILSEGVEKEKHFFDEFEHIDIITHYTQWELIYEDMDGQKHRFTFHNQNGRKSPREHMEDSIENYFCDLVQQYYQQEFWDGTIARIPGGREKDSAFYFQSYRLFSMPDVPETSIMFDQRLHYSLSENIDFPQLQFCNVFHDFPYILNMYLYVTYESSEATKRTEQRQEIETCLQEMIHEMAEFTNHSLNASITVTMMDDQGAAGSFSYAVLNGEFFEKGRGLEFEMALHENFFKNH